MRLPSTATFWARAAVATVPPESAAMAGLNPKFPFAVAALAPPALTEGAMVTRVRLSGTFSPRAKCRAMPTSTMIGTEIVCA